MTVPATVEKHDIRRNQGKCCQTILFSVSIKTIKVPKYCDIKI